MCRFELESHLKRNRKRNHSAQTNNNNKKKQIKTAKIYFHLSDWQNTFKDG